MKQANFIFIFLVALILVSYQNCGPNNTDGLFETPFGSSTSCEIKSYNSAGTSQNSYYVGEIANFSLKSAIDGQIIQYSLQKNDVIIQNTNVASPYYFQLTNRDNTFLGDYVLTMNLLEDGKSVCTKSVSFTVQLEGTTSCQLTASNGTNFKTNQKIPFLITSNPTGMNSFLSTTSNLWNRKAKGTTAANFEETITTPGTYTVYAEVSNTSGVYQRCAPDVILNITAAPASPTPASPTPVSPTPVSPTPTPANLSFNAGGLILAGGESKVASNLTLKYQTDGNLVILNTSNAVLWSVGITKACTSGCKAQFQADGNLVLYQNNVAYWATNTIGPNFKLKIVATTPFITVTTSSGVPVFAGNDRNMTDMSFARGQFFIYTNSIRSSSTVRMKLKSSGELIIYNPSGVILWSSGTVGRTCGNDCFAVFQTDGNFVLYQGSTFYWATNVVANTLVISADSPFLDPRP